jgi:hypothetical protein
MLVFCTRIETPDKGPPAMSLTTPVTVLTCAPADKETIRKKRKNVSLRRELWPGEGDMCSNIAIVLEFKLPFPKLVENN